MSKKKYAPIEVSPIDLAFGGKAMEILPAWDDIPKEFWGVRNEWARWVNKWFFNGLKQYPVPAPGVDLQQAMQNLQCVLGSYAPKHEHKEAGVAYLASLWFTSPDGDPINSKATGATP